MSKKVIAGLVFCALALPMSAAFATAPIQGGGTDTWTDIKNDCLNWQQYHQLPLTVTISCSDWRTLWTQESGKIPMWNLGHFEHRFATNKACIGHAGQEIGDGRAPFAPLCPIFTEWRRERRINPVVTCDDVVRYSSAREFCDERLNSLPESEVVKTRLRVIDTCSSSSGSSSGSPTTTEADLPEDQDGQ
ncbi:MAG: hypothetical protein QM820_29380 [Minicystis sp.]